jgi:hypothetical protein
MTRFAATTVAPTPQTLTVPEGRAEAIGSLTGVSTGPRHRNQHLSTEPSSPWMAHRDKGMIYTELNPLDLLLVDSATLSMVPEPVLASR